MRADARSAGAAAVRLGDRAVDAEQDHRADDGADEAAEVERLVVADAEQLREQEEADQ
jgi:hypothetical protein